MNKFCLIPLLLLCFATGSRLFAQEQDFNRRRSEYVFGDNTQFGGFGGPFVEFGATANEFSVMTGGGGGVLFNRSFFIGGFGQGLSNDLSYSIPYEGRRERMKLDLGMGGVWLGYSYPAHKAVHLIAQGKVGFGTASLVPENPNLISRDAYVDDSFICFSPSAGMEVNFAPWFRMSFEGGYRYFSGGQLPFVDNLGGAYGSATLRFGWFE